MHPTLSNRRFIPTVMMIFTATCIALHAAIGQTLPKTPAVEQERNTQVLTQIIVWNRIAQAVKMEVTVDDSIVYAGLISIPIVPEQIGGGRLVQMSLGKHRLRVKDATRGLVQDTVYVATDEQAGVSQVINVRVDAAGPVVRFTRGISP
jgi:hypothetical protein